MIRGKGIKNIAQSLKRLVSLQIITLDFSNKALSASIISELAAALKKLKDPKSINLNFAGCTGITDLAIQKLASALRNLTSLRDIDLNFGENNDAGVLQVSRVKDTGMKKLAQALSKLLSLQSLTLDFYL